MRASSPSSGSLLGGRGLSHSTVVQRAALESYLPAPPPTWVPLSLLGLRVPGGTSQAILFQSLWCSQRSLVTWTPSVLLPPCFLLSPPPIPHDQEGQGPTFPFHYFTAASPQVHGQKGGLPYSVTNLWLGPQSLVLDRVGEGMWVPASSYWVCQPRRLSPLFLATCQGCVCREQTEG